MLELRRGRFRGKREGARAWTERIGRCDFRRRGVLSVIVVVEEDRKTEVF